MSVVCEALLDSPGGSVRCDDVMSDDGMSDAGVVGEDWEGGEEWCGSIEAGWVEAESQIC